MDNPPSQVPKDIASLEDLVYRPRLAEGNAKVRRANPWMTVSLTLLGYLALGLVGWLLVRQTSQPVPEPPKQVIVDLGDLPEGEVPQPAGPAPAPAPSGPPPGAIERPDALQPRLPEPPEAPPEKPPESLPTRDQSGVAFPPSPTPNPNTTGTGVGTPGGTGEGTGPSGSGSGTGTGQGTRVVEREYSDAIVLRKPSVTSANYPKNAYSARIQGSVSVELVVGTDGVPVSSRALQGPPMLRSGAEAIALQYRFKPEVRDGVPVMTRFTVKINFSIK